MQAAGIPASHHGVRSRRPMLIGLVAMLAMTALLAVALRPSLPFLPRQGQGTTLAGAFLYQQQRPLSCEYASVHIATTMVGNPISEHAFDDVVPRHENPHLGYRGDILGEWGNTTDYGVYNGPLETALTQFGVRSDAFYGDASTLTDELDAGRPVVVWLALRGDVNSFDVWPDDGARYQLTQWMHVMTAYGYDEDGVYLTDPGTAVWQFYEWDAFMAMWEVMDGMALSVSPG